MWSVEADNTSAYFPYPRTRQVKHEGQGGRYNEYKGLVESKTNKVMMTVQPVRECQMELP